MDRAYTNKLDVIKRLNKVRSERDRAREALHVSEREKAIKAGEDFYFKAEYLSLKGQRKEAIELYQKALEQDPENKIYQIKNKRLTTLLSRYFSK